MATNIQGANGHYNAGTNGKGDLHANSQQTFSYPDQGLTISQQQTYNQNHTQSNTTITTDVGTTSQFFLQNDKVQVIVGHSDAGTMHDVYLF